MKGGPDVSEDRRMEAEQRYIAGDETLAALAKAMAVPLSTLKKWCKAGDWVKKRAKLIKRAMRKAATRTVEKKARELARLLEASDAMERALLTSAKAFEAAMLENPVEIVDGKTRAVNISSVTHAIGRQLESRMLLEGMMSAVDREKIELLKRKQELEEKRAAQVEQAAAEGVRFEIGPDEESEEYSQ